MNSQPFGHFSPNFRMQLARKVCAKLGRDPVSKFARSSLKNFALLNSKNPIDVTIFDDQCARLHPQDNICEKRVLLTPHLWEPEERAQLQKQIEYSRNETFVFVDAGANVGLYSLFARHIAHKNGKKIRAICIEPGNIVRSRLIFNMSASGASDDVSIYPCALSDREETVSFSADTQSLGESKTTAATHNDNRAIELIEARPLHHIISDANLAHIDCLKIDIEGREYPVIKAFLNTAPKNQYPSLILMETAHAESKEKLDSLLAAHSYNKTYQTQFNTIYTHTN